MKKWFRKVVRRMKKHNYSIKELEEMLKEKKAQQEKVYKFTKVELAKYIEGEKTNYLTAAKKQWEEELSVQAEKAKLVNGYKGTEEDLSSATDIEDILA